jgi:hypothetical protein
MTYSSMPEKARQVVEEELKIKDFIEKHESDIYARLEECDVREMDAKARGDLEDNEVDVIFMSESLPFISGIIHVGSSLKNFNNGIDWVRKNLPDADAVAVLSALTFLYIVQRGSENARKGADENKLEILGRICRRVNKLLGGNECQPLSCP